MRIPVYNVYGKYGKYKASVNPKDVFKVMLDKLLPSNCTIKKDVDKYFIDFGTGHTLISKNEFEQIDRLQKCLEYEED